MSSVDTTFAKCNYMKFKLDKKMNLKQKRNIPKNILKHRNNAFLLCYFAPQPHTVYDLDCTLSLYREFESPLHFH